jgi:DNA-3-methyladenine glycosylase
MAGPGTLSQALGITTKMTGTVLGGPEIWIEDQSLAIPEDGISVGPRIGVDYAEEDAARPYRFVLADGSPHHELVRRRCRSAQDL